MRAELRKGWCPSALRPMESGDGLIVRLGQKASILSPAKARALAELAKCFGNGLFDLSARGNLQLRGVRASSLNSLQRKLDDLDLIEAEDGPGSRTGHSDKSARGTDPQRFSTFALRRICSVSELPTHLHWLGFPQNLASRSMTAVCFLSRRRPRISASSCGDQAVMRGILSCT